MKVWIPLRALLIAGFATLALPLAGAGMSVVIGTSTGLFAQAVAAQESSEGPGVGVSGSGSGQGQTSERGGGLGNGQTGIGDKIFRGQGKHGAVQPVAEAEGSKPNASGGGKPAIAGTKKGDIYGDLWVVLRDPLTGAPILDENGNVQPILADGTVVQLTPEGDLPDQYADLVQEVTFSRLSASRSPSKITDKALAEALSAIQSADEITYDAAGRIVVIKDGVATAIDSPLENLALYVYAIKTGSFTLEQAASYLAAASDKTQSITLDVVVCLNTILGLNGTTGTNYVDYTTFTYDRSEVYSGDVTYLEPNGDGTYTTVTKPIIEAIFHDENVDKTGADAFVLRPV